MARVAGNPVLSAVSQIKTSRKAQRLLAAIFYFVIGCLAYRRFEGWDTLDSVYVSCPLSIQGPLGYKPCPHSYHRLPTRN